MLERLKTALVDSFVGAIAIGFVFSQGIARLVGIVFSPIIALIQQRQTPDIFNSGVAPQGLLLQTVLPQLLDAVATLLIGYGLLRWLYYPPAPEQPREETPEPEEDGEQGVGDSE